MQLEEAGLVFVGQDGQDRTGGTLGRTGQDRRSSGMDRAGRERTGGTLGRTGQDKRNSRIVRAGGAPGQDRRNSGMDRAGQEELRDGQEDLQDRFRETTVVQVRVTVQCTHVTGLEVLSPNHPCIENMCRKVGGRRSEGNMLSKKEM